jgi:hypothetical protein
VAWLDRDHSTSPQFGELLQDSIPPDLLPFSFVVKAIAVGKGLSEGRLQIQRFRRCVIDFNKFLFFSR